jgi:5-methylcytosine-specific restriction endonuclease McrA
VPSKPSNDDIYFRDGGVCAYCGQKIAQVEATVDHITPRWAGGKSTWENLVCACKRCNNRKGGRTPSEAGMTLLHNPHIPNMHPSPALAYM